MASEISFSPFPVLETERLILEKFNISHARRLYELRSDDRVMQYVERPRPLSVTDVIPMITSMDELIATNTGVAWAIRLKTETEMAGTIGFWRMKKENFRAEIGYMMLPEYWSKGIMSEAMEAVLNYAFGKMGLHSIEADINPLNTGSQKILERHGFLREAYFRENYYWEGEFYDSAIYSLLVSDYMARKKLA